MHAVILAAGRGTRLLPQSKHTPKPLIRILDRAIIEHTIQSLQKAGIRDLIIVIGHLGHLIKEHLGNGDNLGVKIQYCYNQFHMLENAISLKVAEEKIPRGQPFLLLMGDHYFEGPMIETALGRMEYYPLLCIDRSPRHPPQIKDATKVLVDANDLVIDIGKSIPVWNAIDTGLFILDGTIFEVIRLLEKMKPSLTITDCIRYLTLNVKPVRGLDVSGYLWFDIDAPQDIDFVNSFLAGSPKCRGSGME